MNAKKSTANPTVTETKTVAPEEAKTAAKPATAKATKPASEKKTTVKAAKTAAEKTAAVKTDEKPAAAKSTEKKAARSTAAKKTADEKKPAAKTTAKRAAKSTAEKPAEKKTRKTAVVNVEAICAKLEKKISKTKAAAITEKIAVDIEVYGFTEGESSQKMYVELNEGKATVSPHSYDAKDFRIAISLDNAIAFVNGKTTLKALLDSEGFYAEGNIAKAIKLASIF